MAKLPIYTNSANIQVADRVQAPSNPWGAVDQNAKALAELSVKWQQTQNAAEALDGKNKMVAAVNDILTEAEEYRDYKSPKDLENKQQELEKRLEEVLPEITNGFTNGVNANNFTQEQQLTMIQNGHKLKQIFREKYIDNDAANRVISYDNNKQAFISTGSDAYKKSYLADLQNSLKAGFISEKEYAQQSLAVKDWDFDYATNLALDNPDAAKQYAKGIKGDALKKAKLSNFIDAQKKRIDNETTQSMIDEFQANPTAEGLAAIEARVPNMKEKTLEALRETYRRSPNYEAVSTFEGLKDAQNTLAEISNINDDNANNAMVKLDAMAKYIKKLNRSNIANTLSDDDHKNIANAAYRALNDSMFKEQVHTIFGKPNAFSHFVNWGLGDTSFNRVEAIGLETIRNTIQALMDDKPEEAAQIYAKGQEEAIKIRYPEIFSQNPKKGDVIWYAPTGQALKFMGYGLDDVLVEVDPTTGAAK